MVYGATSHLGTLTAKVFAAHGYALLLIDGNLAKLQQLEQELYQVFPKLNKKGNTTVEEIEDNSESLVKIVSMNLGTDPNSTVIEHKLHKALFGEKTWKEDEIYEQNSEAFQPDAPQPPPVLHQRSHMKCINVQVFVNCTGLDKDMIPTNEKIFHELQFD